MLVTVERSRLRGTWVRVQGACGPQRPPDGGARDTGLGLLNHAVLWLLFQGPPGGNPVGLRILTLGVKCHQRVVKFFQRRLLHSAVFYLFLSRLCGLSLKRPCLQLQIRIIELTLQSILTMGPEWLWILTSFDPLANYPPGQEQASPQQKQQKRQQGKEYLEPHALALLELLLAACTVGGSHGDGDSG